MNGKLGCAGTWLIVGSLLYTACAPERPPRRRLPVDGGVALVGEWDSGRDASPANGDASTVDGASPDKPCVPVPGPDLPDESFADTDCDGIDGTKTDAVFVAPSGLLGNPGTMGAPLDSIQPAIALAADSGKSSVYVCGGSYDENVRIETVGISVYGGFDCTDWHRVATAATISPETGAPLTVRNTSAPVVLSHLVFQAPSTVTFNESSIAAVIMNSSRVTFRHASLLASDAGAGQPALPPSPPNWTVPAPGADSLYTGAFQCTSSAANCGGTIGGTKCTLISAGGTAPPRSCASDPNTPLQGGPGGAGGNCAVGALLQAGSFGTPPGLGERGSDGVAGVPALSGFGSVANGWYVGSNNGGPGAYGKPGNSGKGGNGADSSGAPSGGPFNVGSGGGQGGYPGCPGRGGEPGVGGGASIALLVTGTIVELDTCNVTTGKGGIGGLPSPGVEGQPGGSPGKGGTGPNTNVGQTGQPGGAGGTGGPGGPGGGGPSIGIVYTGSRPIVVASTYSLGMPGPGGTFQAAKGADGVSTEMYAADLPDGGL